MPRVENWKVVEKSYSCQPTATTAVISAMDTPNGEVVFQLATGGSKDRKYPGKVSQTLQFDRAAAKRLYDELGKAFNF